MADFCYKSTTMSFVCFLHITIKLLRYNGNFFDNFFCHYAVVSCQILAIYTDSTRNLRVIYTGPTRNLRVMDAKSICSSWYKECHLIENVSASAGAKHVARRGRTRHAATRFLSAAKWRGGSTARVGKAGAYALHARLD